MKKVVGDRSIAIGKNDFGYERLNVVAQCEVQAKGKVAQACDLNHGEGQMIEVKINTPSLNRSKTAFHRKWLGRSRSRALLGSAPASGYTRSW